MKNPVSSNGNRTGKKNKSTKEIAKISDKGILSPDIKHADTLSSTSLIVFRLLAESKQGEFLNILRIKLGKTKEEIHLIISQL